MKEKFCTECKEFHEAVSFCEKCGACLYQHSTQIKNDMYPLFECLRCGQTNFWD